MCVWGYRYRAMNDGNDARPKIVPASEIRVSRHTAVANLKNLIRGTGGLRVDSLLLWQQDFEFSDYQQGSMKLWGQ